MADEEQQQPKPEQKLEFKQVDVNTFLKMLGLEAVEENKEQDSADR
jgi:hypothetical protein